MLQCVLTSTVVAAPSAPNCFKIIHRKILGNIYSNAVTPCTLKLPVVRTIPYWSSCVHSKVSFADFLLEKLAELSLAEVNFRAVP